MNEKNWGSIGNSLEAFVISAGILHVNLILYKNLAYIDRRISEALKYQPKSSFMGEKSGIRFHLKFLLNILEVNEIDTSFILPVAILLSAWLLKLIIVKPRDYKIKSVWAIAILVAGSIFSFRKTYKLPAFYSVIPITIALALHFMAKFKKTAFIEEISKEEVDGKKVYLRIFSLISTFVLMLTSLLAMEIVRSFR